MLATSQIWTKNSTIPICVLVLFLTSFTVKTVTAQEDACLAFDLYQDRMWAACSIEARRLLLSRPDNYEARLLLARADRRRQGGGLPAFTALALDFQAPDKVRWAAGYEQAVLLWQQNRPAEAAEALRLTFLNTQDSKLFLRSGCALYIVLRYQPMPWGGAMGIGPQLRSSAPQWTSQLISSVREEFRVATPSVNFQPGRYVIAFYRSQISPAIGNRCVLYPSCSEYARQAFNTHGFFIGTAMTTDRFIREPGVVAAAMHPIHMPSGNTAYADPLSDHNWWFYAPLQD